MGECLAKFKHLILHCHIRLSTDLAFFDSLNMIVIRHQENSTCLEARLIVTCTGLNLSAVISHGTPLVVNDSLSECHRF